MNLWQAPRKAEAALNNELRPFASAYEDIFTVVDECAERLAHVDSPFARASTIILIKWRNLVLGCYSLCLDGLAQEGGALLRPLIESLELLTYLRLDPRRVDSVLTDKPSAGAIAKEINGKFQGLREYLNLNSSHLSMTPYSVGHLIDLNTAKFRLVQQHNDAVLRQNLKTLLAVFGLLMVEVVNCVSVASGAVDNVLADRAVAVKTQASSLLEWPNKSKYTDLHN